jgi:phosphohistidine swiveling domain-containing protein
MSAEVARTEIEPPPGFWVREASHAPQPPTPLTRPFWQHRTWFRVVCAELGVLVDTLDMQEIGGWLYLRVVPLIDKLAPVPTDSLRPLLFQAVPELRQRLARCVTVVDTDVPGQLIRRWHNEWRDEFTARITAYRAVDLAALTDTELARHYDTALAISEDGSQLHYRLWGAVVVAMGRLELTCRELLGWAPGDSLRLLDGTSTRSTEPARALREMVDLARRTPRVATLLAERADPNDVLAASPDFAAAFAAYQHEFGCRALAYDLGEPILAERVDAILGLVREQLDREPADPPPVAERALADARTLLTDQTARSRFDRDLAGALAAYPAREDNEFFTISAPLALLRLTAREIGRRLCRRGQLGDVDDVFHLEVPELLGALTDHGDQRELVDRRRTERNWTLANPGPASYGTPVPPPDLAGLPEQARQVNFSFWWAIEQIIGPEGNTRTHPPRTRELHGIPAAPGRYRGPVRVIRDETDFDRLRAGDVLVCAAFAPVWSVLLANTGALITNQGGPLSHAAIIAREFGVPCVVATGDGTHRLRDGQIVDVDGTSGVVLIQR